MKIASLAVSATAFLHLKGPDKVPLYDDGKPVGIDLYGPGTPEFARVEERQRARTVARMADNDNKVVHVPAAERRAEATEDFADLTAGFRHLEEDGADGQPLTGRALYTTVYGNPQYGWATEQVAKFVVDWGKFTPGA